MKTDIYFIGMGGIGSQLCEPICRYIVSLENFLEYRIVFIDGDEYENSNKSRQNIDISDIGENKSKSQFIKMTKLFNKLEIVSIPIYINKQNIKDIINIKNNVIILAGVDNNKTRKVIQDFCCRLDDVLLLSGGNEYIDGDVQIYAKKKGLSLSPEIWKYNPSIKKPKDKSPDEVGCEELILTKSDPQLIFTNGMVSSCMQMAFYRYYKIFTEDIEIDKNVIYFDLNEMACVSKKRN